MAFWRYIQSNIQTLLDKPDVTLEEILLESDILQEIRGHSSNLMQYMVKPHIMEELVGLIIHDPNPQLDYTLQYKLPNLACEVLTFDIPEINDALMSSPQLLTRICNVFRQEDALNDLTASFVCKLLIVLATKRTDKFLEFIRQYNYEQTVAAAAKEEKTDDNQQLQQNQEQQPSNESSESADAAGDVKAVPTIPTDDQQQPPKVQDELLNPTAPVPVVPESSEKPALFVDMLLNHINNSAIKDLFNKMIACVDNPELRPKVVEWLADAQLVPKLVALLSSDNSEQVVTNSAKCLCKIIKIGREQQMALQEKCPPDPLLASIEEVSLITEIIDHAIPQGSDDSSAWTLYESNFILLALLQYKRTAPSFQDIMIDTKCFLSSYAGHNDSSPTLGELDQERATLAIQKCLTALTGRLQPLVANLSQEQKETFGAVRLEIVKLVAAMVSCNDEANLIAIRDLKVLPVILKLFFSYPFCSQLHNQVDIIVKDICTPPKSKNNEKPTDITFIKPETDEPSAAPTDSNSEDKQRSDSEPPPPKHILFDQLFYECQLLNGIVQNYSTSPKEQKGYNGHLRLMANYAVNMSENSFKKYYDELMESLDTEFKERWTAFRETLAEINSFYDKTVCMINTTASCSEADDPEDLRDMGLPSAETIAGAQQALNDYQMNQMTASSIDKFGFEDDEFTDVDIPAMSNMASPPLEDHSSDEESGDTENCDPWNKMSQDFNPWNLAGTSKGDEGRDDWADFGSAKTDLTESSATNQTAKQADSGQNQQAQDENWADFASFETMPPGAAKDNGSDDEF